MRDARSSLKRWRLNWTIDAVFFSVAVTLMFGSAAIGLAANNGVSDSLTVPGSFAFVQSAEGLSGQGLPIPFAGSAGAASLGNTRDFDDLHEFNPGFNSVRSDDGTGSYAVQVMSVVWLGDSRPVSEDTAPVFQMPQPAEALRVRDWQSSGIVGGKLMPRTIQGDGEGPISDESSSGEAAQSNAVGIAYGLGTVETSEEWRVNAYGSVIGDSSWSNDVENQIVGPKGGIVWRNRRGPWLFDVLGSVLLGFNSGQIDSTNRLGNDLIPGAVNRLLYMRPMYIARNDERQLISPVGELRAQSRLRLTDSLSLRTTWSSLLIGNLLQQTDVHFALPETTFVVENESLLIHQIYCGVEYVH